MRKDTRFGVMPNPNWPFSSLGQRELNREARETIVGATFQAFECLFARQSKLSQTSLNYCDYVNNDRARPNLCHCHLPQLLLNETSLENNLRSFYHEYEKGLHPVEHQLLQFLDRNYRNLPMQKKNKPVNLNNVNIDRKRLLTVAASEGLLT
jgi:hypothetical protein